MQEHPVVRTLWVRRDGGGVTADFIVARPYSTVVVSNDATGRFRVGVRRPGELQPSSGRVATAVGIEMHPWITSSVADEIAASLCSDRLLELLSADEPWRCGDILLASVRDYGTVDRATVAAVRAALDPGGSRHTRPQQSPRTRRRIVRAATGVSVTRLRRMTRAAVARALLQDAGMSLAVAAHTAGYADQAHMTREFRELCGYSPGQWRAHVAAWSRRSPTPSG